MRRRRLVHVVGATAMGTAGCLGVAGRLGSGDQAPSDQFADGWKDAGIPDSVDDYPTSWPDGDDWSPNYNEMAEYEVTEVGPSVYHQAPFGPHAVHIVNDTGGLPIGSGLLDDGLRVGVRVIDTRQEAVYHAAAYRLPLDHYVRIVLQKPSDYVIEVRTNALTQGLQIACSWFDCQDRTRWVAMLAEDQGTTTTQLSTSRACSEDQTEC